MTNPSCSHDSEELEDIPLGLTRLNWVVAGRDVNTILRFERTRALLPRAPSLRGQSPQMRGLGRDEHKTGLRWGPLPCALQRLEADVRLLPAQIPVRILISHFALFYFTAGTSGSLRRASSNLTRPTLPFRRNFQRLRPPPLRPVLLPRKPPRRLVAHNQEEGGVRRAGVGPKGGGKTTMGHEDRRCAWPCQTP